MANFVVGFVCIFVIFLIFESGDGRRGHPVVAPIEQGTVSVVY